MFYVNGFPGQSFTIVNDCYIEFGFLPEIRILIADGDKPRVLQAAVETRGQTPRATPRPYNPRATPNP